MNSRDRWLETILFGNPDKVPLEPGNGRESTMIRWRSEGLPEEVANITEYAYRAVGGRHRLAREEPSFGLPLWTDIRGTFPINERMIPHYEEKVIKRGPRTQIVQDWKGNVCEIGNEFTPEYLRGGVDFVTRRWIKCPVESRKDWDDMKCRYNPEDTSRLPEDAEALGRRLVRRDYPIEISLSGLFWQLREWLGFENLCIMFHDNPSLVKEMALFWEEYIVQLIERVFEHVVPDSVHFSEDMAYKGFSMISPEMVYEFLFPAWKRWGEVIRHGGCQIYGVDSDGYIGELIPIWIEAGMNFCDPVEVAAGNDIVELRQRFGRDMAYRGGIDKRCIAKGGQAIEDEIMRVEPIIQDGGYIPSCDHGVPPDVSWPNFLHYVRLLARATGWL